MRSKLFNKKNLLDKGKIILIAGCIILIVYLITKPMNIELMSNCGCSGGGGRSGGSFGGGSYSGLPVTGSGPQSFANGWVAACGKNVSCAEQCPAAMTIAQGESTFRAQVTGKGGAIGGWQIDPSNPNYSAMQNAGSNLAAQANIVQGMTQNGVDWGLWATCTEQGGGGDQVRARWSGIGDFTEVCNNAYKTNKISNAKPNVNLPAGCSQ